MRTNAIHSSPGAKSFFVKINRYINLALYQILFYFPSLSRIENISIISRGDKKNNKIQQIAVGVKWCDIHKELYI